MNEEHVLDGALRPAPDDPWRALLHRWFVQYNPSYLLSAALVLAGLTLVSRGLAGEQPGWGQGVVALLAEVYAWALLGGAALLVRKGQQRPAVLLGLLAMVYQADLTLFTETCADLGLRGVAPAALWLSIFVAKLAALGKALRVRISTRALAAASFGASGLVLLPFLARFLDTRRPGSPLLSSQESGYLVGFFLFALLALVPRDPGRSAAPLGALDAWGKTVLRRASLAVWSIWGAAFAFHAWVWVVQHSVDPVRSVMAVLTFLIARQRSERRVWGAALAALALSLVSGQGVFGVSLWIALGLTLRAMSRGRRPGRAAPEAPEAQESSPYRATSAAPGEAAPEVEELSWVSSGERLRLLSGALFAAYLAAWLPGWRGGALPHHVVSLDLVVVALSLLAAWRYSWAAGARPGLALSTVVLTHGALSLDLIPRPRSFIEWGGLLLALGFVLLGGSLGVSSWLARRLPIREPA
jgi:hypothetical protein